jgi:Xaa-Pro aminopeptidase
MKPMSLQAEKPVKLKPNVPALKALLARENLAALICMSPENFTYLSGVFILTVPLIRPRQAFAVIPAAGDPFLVVCSIEKNQLQAEGWIGEIHSYIEFTENPVDKLSLTLEQKGITQGAVGLDLDYIAVSSFNRLQQKLPAVNFVNTTSDVAQVRAIKTWPELQMLETAVKQTHRAVLDAMAASRLGESERTIANRVVNNIINYGADGTLFVCFASGARTPQPHAHATELVPEEGEIIHVDVGGTYGAWASDFARTYSTGKPTAVQREIYRNLCEAQESTIKAIRPGVVAEDLFFICRDEFKRRGIPFHMPHVGHSFGVELHEKPILRPGEKAKLTPGMALNVEPTVVYEDRAYHNEDLVVVTETGARVMSLGLAPKDLPEIGSRLP